MNQNISESTHPDLWKILHEFETNLSQHTNIIFMVYKQMCEFLQGSLLKVKNLNLFTKAKRSLPQTTQCLFCLSHCACFYTAPTRRNFNGKSCCSCFVRFRVTKTSDTDPKLFYWEEQSLNIDAPVKCYLTGFWISGQLIAKSVPS